MYTDKPYSNNVLLLILVASEVYNRDDPSHLRGFTPGHRVSCAWGRRCAWVREATAVRMCPGRVARFERDTRGAANVEPNVQSQWVQVMGLPIACTWFIRLTVVCRLQQQHAWNSGHSSCCT